MAVVEMLIQNGADVNAKDMVNVCTFHNRLRPFESTKEIVSWLDGKNRIRFGERIQTAARYRASYQHTGKFWWISSW